MPTFSIYELPYLRRAADRARAARAIATTTDTTGNGHADFTSQHTAADAITLRGIPAVGRSMAGGHIAGTQPEAAATR